ncbi:MAG TPA: cupredoxin domain-containing protein [Gaiellaceae bacterium]|nr:cupredoxin domain-containing protein [Gaiellaceae bacterium]
MNKKRQTALVSAGLAVALALAGAAVAAFQGRAAATSTTIKVTEREYHIALSTTAPAAGTITFKIHNAGHVLHQLDVSGGGLKAIAKAGPIKPGATKSFTVKLAGGTVNVWCPVPGHAALGMKATLKVKGATGASTPTPTPNTTPSSSTWG